MQVIVILAFQQKLSSQRSWHETYQVTTQYQKDGKINCDGDDSNNSCADHGSTKNGGNDY